MGDVFNLPAVGLKHAALIFGLVPQGIVQDQIGVRQCKGCADMDRVGITGETLPTNMVIREVTARPAITCFRRSHSFQLFTTAFCICTFSNV